MGRVVKGSRVSSERYTVGVPEISPPSNGHVDDSNSVGIDDAGDTFGSFLPEEPVAEPTLDTAAVRVAADGLIDDAMVRAESLLGDARDRARALVEDAAIRVSLMHDQARTDGRKDGYAVGADAANREMSEMLETMRGLVDMAGVERHKIISAAEPEIVRLAMGIAERVLHQQIALDRGVVVEMAKAAIARLVDRESITVRVNPADLEGMRGHRDDVLALGDVKSMRIIEDQRVDRGGVVVETEAGTIDAKIQTQITEAKRVLHIEDDVVLTSVDEPGLYGSAARAS